MSGYYVDNAMNRRLGRVGMRHGTAVHSSSGSSSSPRTYVDNAMNRRLGRVGLPHGSAVHSSSGVSSSPRVYVDNSMNRSLGRVGLPHGSAVHSRNSQSSYTSPLAYVDNELGCQLQRAFCLDEVVQSNDHYSDRLLGEIEKLKKLMRDRDETTAKKNDLRNEKVEPIFAQTGAAKKSDSRKDKIPLKPEQTIAFEELKLREKVGGGGFGDVYDALWKNQQVAVKKLRVQRVHQKKRKEFEDEVRSISRLTHPNVVQFYGACVVTPNLAIVMEFLEGGTLYDNLYEYEVQFDEKTKNQFILDCFSALKYVHSKNMAHRDIKSKNIMLCDEKTRCKLTDFGLALKDDCETNATTKDFAGFAGTVKYCPKEVIDGKRLSIEELKLADVYSLALTTFELLTEEEPFSDCKKMPQILKAIADGEILQTLAASDGISAVKKNLLKLALSQSQNRPTAAQFLTRFNDIIAPANALQSSSYKTCKEF